MGNYFDSFSVLFGKQELFLNGRSYPLGQFATDFLNLDERELSEIEQRIGAFLSTVLPFMQEKTDSAAASSQEKLNTVWDLIFQLPFYRELSMDLEFAYQLLTIMIGDHEAWAEVLDVNSEGHAAFEKFLNGLEYSRRASAIFGDR